MEQRKIYKVLIFYYIKIKINTHTKKKIKNKQFMKAILKKINIVAKVYYIKKKQAVFSKEYLRITKNMKEQK